MGVALNSTLQDLFSEGSWAVRHARSEKQVQVQAYLSSLELSSYPDKVKWIVNGVEWSKYSTGAIYNLVKPHGSLVPWRNVVWNRGGIPKHSFLTWLVTLNRLPTKDRPLSWGLQVSPGCVLCSSPLVTESRDHLFFDCPYALALWNLFASRLNISTSRSWTTTLSNMQSLQGPPWLKKLSLLVWQLTLYSLWFERNARIHKQIFRSHSQIAVGMDRTIKNRIHSFRDNNPATTSLMMQFWLRSPH